MDKLNNHIRVLNRHHSNKIFHHNRFQRNNNYQTNTTTNSNSNNTYIIYPLAIAKLLGLVAILSRKSELLKEWAYAGFFYNVVLAFFAHVMINDNQQWGALAAMVLLLTSYFFQRRAFAND